MCKQNLFTLLFTIAIIVNAPSVYSQTAVSRYYTTPVPNTTETYTTAGFGSGFYPGNSLNHTINFGKASPTLNGYNTVLDSFSTANGLFFRRNSDALPYSKINIVRVNNSFVTGNKVTSLAQVTHRTINGSNNITDQYDGGYSNTIYLAPSYFNDMESLLNSFILNRGTDNIFANRHLNESGAVVNSTYNNVERVDLIIENGITIMKSNYLNQVGFLINERMFSATTVDQFKISVIKSLNVSNNVATLGSFLNVGSSTSHWGISNVTNNPELQITSMVFQKNATDATLMPSQLIAPQNIGGTFISLSDLGVTVGDKIYGISLYPNDATSPAITLTAANTNTNTSGDSNDGGLDMMGGSFFGISQLVRNGVTSVSGNIKRLSNTTQTTLGENITGLSLYVYLIDNSNNIIAKTTVNSDGTYNLSNVPFGNYTVRISGANANIGQTYPGLNLPGDYTLTGEVIGTSGITDGNVNGSLAISHAVDVYGYETNNVNFGLNRRPKSYDVAWTVNAPSPVKENVHYQLGLDEVNDITQTLSGDDPEDSPASGSINESGNFKIVTLPNANYVTLYYNNNPVTPGQEIRNYNPALMTVTFNNFISISGADLSFTYSTIDNINVTSVPSKYSIHLGSAVLPVSKLIALINDKSINWEFVNDLNAAYFEIEESTNGINFSSISKVNATNNEKYSFNLVVNNGLKKYYRIKAVLVNGKTAFSNTIVYNITNAINKITVFPNPVTNNNLFVEFSESGNYTINIYNHNGILVSSKDQFVEKGNVINASNTALKTGNFIVTIINKKDKKHVLNKKIIVIN